MPTRTAVALQYGCSGVGVASVSSSDTQHNGLMVVNGLKVLPVNGAGLQDRDVLAKHLETVRPLLEARGVRLVSCKGCKNRLSTF